MKIQTLSEEHRAKAYALLRNAFPESEYEATLVQLLHARDKPLHEWVCLHTGKAIAYIAFANAYQGRKVCGLHLAMIAVSPEFQKQGVGAELLRFALRQAAIKEQALFVLGAPAFFQKFGFEPCSSPLCPYTRNNTNFMSLRNLDDTNFTVGYEPEFKAATKQTRQKEEIRPAKGGVKKRH
ncbi:GNAT family N-acetyltransferase [Geopsychrobacter electrodiphilus]|uniref:GNAT family N-acetyltransferase n=1 Tax=Geopsychrobacter electrodiphilus TaxID=225196 RepID=UPI0003647AE3|nr:N-acetyltransferase [Geopsychrobacter electrodiphilus]